MNIDIKLVLDEDLFLPSTLRIPSLSLLKARSFAKDSANFLTENCLLFSLFSLPSNQELPIAAVTGLIDNLPVKDNFWIRADPIKLQSDFAAVYFLEVAPLNLELEGLKEVKDTLKHLLSERGLTLFTPHPSRWYVRVPWLPRLDTFSPEEVLGKDIGNYLPVGLDKNFWRMLLTEIQMVLHQYMGQSRSLWFWGSGALPIKPTFPWKKIWTNNLVAQGLAQVGEVPWNLPETFNDCLQEMISGSSYLIILNGVREKLEVDWLCPIIRALRRQKISSLMLHTQKHSYYITSKTIYYFWRS